MALASDIPALNILVSGASRGIGRALFDRYDQAGHRVVGFARTRGPDAPEGLLVADATSFNSRILPDDMQARIDRLILNHAVFGPGPGRTGDVTPADLNSAFRTNCASDLRIIRQCLPALRAAGGARVAFIISKGGLQKNIQGPGALCYRVSKAAQIALGLGIADELASDGITCVLINPGWVQTGLGGKNAPHAAADSAARIVAILEAASPADAGRLFDWDGSSIKL